MLLAAPSACGFNHGNPAASASSSSPAGSSGATPANLGISDVEWADNPAQLNWTYSGLDADFTIQSCDIYNSCYDIVRLSCIGRTNCVATDAQSNQLIPNIAISSFYTTQNKDVRQFQFSDPGLQAFSSNGSRRGNVRVAAFGIE